MTIRKNMDFRELLKLYHSLQVENNDLKKEIKSLKDQLAGLEMEFNFEQDHINVPQENAESNYGIKVESDLTPPLNKRSDSSEKIKLFMSLFHGREDVYARRWENKKKGSSGYSPVCNNEWKTNICPKPSISCAECKHKNYNALTSNIIEDHLRGNEGIVTGIYPMLLDETCWFLAIDFDDEEWQKDISVLREICSLFDIPVAIERSRSGKGAHAWFFFKNPLSASLARKFGSALLTYSMNKRHEITFKSYDRFFPNQDTMPKGGFGNLIALPLQKEARSSGNSVFIDSNFKPFEDQWEYLSSIKKLDEVQIQQIIIQLCHGNELGILKQYDEEETKPWETSKIKLEKNDFPQVIEIVKANMLFIPKSGFSQRSLNHLKRLAAFKNPEFYRAQAMRLPTFNKPRIISCSDETSEYLCLPRGCEEDLNKLFDDLGLKASWIDKTNYGKRIDVEFNGILRDEQPQATSKLLEHENGILCGTTAFGKTISAIKLITERKVNTLILVNKISLVNQWKQKLTDFLVFNELLLSSDSVNEKANIKKEKKLIGQLGGGKQSLTGIIDVAVLQSLGRLGEVKECIKDYGMVIVDECHHVPAFSFEMVLKNVNAKYVYGLTATPTRKDGHHPIIFMQCGPIRFRDDAKKQAEKRPFEHYVIPRFTSFKLSSRWEKEEKDITIQELYAEIFRDEWRNQLIVDDVVQCHKRGRNSLILTERTAHVMLLFKELSSNIPGVIPFVGTMGEKQIRESLSRIKSTPVDQPITIVATGRYIGEGFDEPRLDTLFLAMPISWKGTLQQYAGRLHRLYKGKNEAIIYDYVDIHVRMFENMYNKRLTGYRSIGYKVKGEELTAAGIDFIFDKSNFLPVYTNDIMNVSGEILIVSPFVTKRRTLQMIQNLEIAITKKVKVVIVTRPAENFADKDLTSWHEAIKLLTIAGVNLVFKSGIHQKFAVIDQRIVWYGSINLMSFGSAEESIMRIESVKIASELTRNL